MIYLEKKVSQEDFDFDFNNFKINDPEYFSVGTKQQVDQNLLEDDQIYKEFSHQDLNQFLFQDKGLAEIFENKGNPPNNLVNENQMNLFNNFPYDFTNSEKPQENTNFFYNNESSNQMPKQMDYTQFFNNEIPFKKENEVDCPKIFNNEAENAFNS